MFTWTLGDLNRAWYGRETLNPPHFHQSRYAMVNLHALWDHGSLEFRAFNSTLHAGKVKAYVQLCLALSHKALTGRGASHRTTQTTNEKFTFRVWLVGLGLKGPEFKTARKHLTAKLSGNSAWRYGQGRRRALVEPPARPTEPRTNTIYLENRNDGHFKFYRIEWTAECAVRTTWGRIGTEGRSAEERFASDAEVAARVEAILKTRRSHGYAVVSDSRVAAA